MTLQLDPARGVFVWMRMYEWLVWKEKKNSLKCYSTVCPEKLWEIYQMSI